MHIHLDSTRKWLRDANIGDSSTFYRLCIKNGDITILKIINFFSLEILFEFTVSICLAEKHEYHSSTFLSLTAVEHCIQRLRIIFPKNWCMPDVVKNQSCGYGTGGCMRERLADSSGYNCFVAQLQGNTACSAHHAAAAWRCHTCIMIQWNIH